MKEDLETDLPAVIRRGASVSLVGKTAAKLAAFAMTLALARNLTVSDYGAFAYVSTWLLCLVIIAVAGLDTASLRYLAQFAGEGDSDRKTVGFVRWARRRVFLPACGLAVLVVFAAVNTDLPGIDRSLLIAASFVLPLLALTQWYQFVFRAKRMVGRADLVGQIIRPSVVVGCVAIATMLGVSLSAAQAMTALFVGTLVSVLVAELWLRSPKTLPIPPPTPLDKRKWNRTALPMLLINASHILLHQLDILMLGSLAGPAHVAPYVVASRLADIVAFSLVVTSAIVAPLISSLYYSGRLDDLGRTLRTSARWVSGIALVVALALAVGRIPLLGVFGTEYIGAEYVLLILVAGQLVNAFAGPVGFLLSMTGNERGSARILGFGVFVNVALNLLLIPKYQATGAAFATTLTTIYWNVAMTSYAQRRLGVRATPI